VIFRRLARWALTGQLWDPILVDELRRRCRSATPAQVAAAAQLLLEERVVHLVAHWVKQTGLRQVTLAGGVFANVKLNQRIAEIDGVEDVFVHPCMGDGGLSLGAALWGSRQPIAEQVEVLHPKLDDVFLGPEYTTDEIRAVLEQAGVSYTEEECVERRIAEAIHDGKVVARFDGRMEYGPRALGNRSIMAAATDTNINDWLNKRLHRSEFMPFAPAVLEEHMSEIFPTIKVGKTLRFMTITLDVDPVWQKRAPAVCHIDGTARPQVLDPIHTPSFYKVVSFYYHLSGLPLVINTSFNMHEEPIVCTPEDAVRAFQMGHLDALAIGPFWTEQASKE
jgi:carbamoyltransferase